MRVLLISDTHVPKRARALPASVWAAAETVDVVIHAGDWVDVSLLDDLERRCKQLVGVWGNNDGDELRSRLPETAQVVLGGVRIAVTHETGAATGREERCSTRFPDSDLLVFGHSHIPWDTMTRTGLRLLNPGSPTDRRRQPHCTMMTLELNDGGIGDVTLHNVD